VTISVPLSATPQGVVEWLEPTARTGLGYRSWSLRMLTISSTLHLDHDLWRGGDAPEPIGDLSALHGCCPHGPFAFSCGTAN
jgi:hypothetical protein